MPGASRGKPEPIEVAPPPVARVASEPLGLNDDATWAAALNAAFTRLQAEVRQRAHSVLGGELARMLGASGQVAAALARAEAPPGPEPRSEPAPGKAARASAATARPSPAPSAQLTAPFLTGEPAAAPAATTRSAARPAKPEPDAPAPAAAVVRRRSARAASGEAAPASSVSDPLAWPAESPPSTPQLTLAGLAPEPDPSELDDAAAGDGAAADGDGADGGDGVEAGSADDAQRERERRRDERREARMQRRQWRQERARQRRAEARMRQASKFPGNGGAPGPGMWSPDAAPANAADAAPAAAGPPARDGASERAMAAQAELALANEAAADDDADMDPDAVEPAQATDGRKRIRWTRESIITELASFLVSGTVIDASFIERYGPPGLVAATRRVFGRFDAALNVAGLHVAKLYPDGPPAR